MNIKSSLMAVAAAGLTLTTACSAHSLRTTPPTIAQRSSETAPDAVNRSLLDNAQPVHLDEPLQDTLTERFSYNNALERLAQIRSALDSFQQLTTLDQERGEAAIATVGNTDWETQHLGFQNWVGAVEGTVRSQELRIKQLELDLAHRQFEDGEISQATLEQKSQAYEAATTDFQTFLQNFSIAD